MQIFQRSKEHHHSKQSHSPPPPNARPNNCQYLPTSPPNNINTPYHIFSISNNHLSSEHKIMSPQPYTSYRQQNKSNIGIQAYQHHQLPQKQYYRQSIYSEQTQKPKSQQFHSPHHFVTPKVTFNQNSIGNQQDVKFTPDKIQRHQHNRGKGSPQIDYHRKISSNYASPRTKQDTFGINKRLFSNQQEHQPRPRAYVPPISMAEPSLPLLSKIRQPSTKQSTEKKSPLYENIANEETNYYPEQYKQEFKSMSKDQIIEQQRETVKALEQKLKQTNKSQVLLEAEQKIKILNQCVTQLRQKLRNFHLKYGKIIQQLDGKLANNSSIIQQSEDYSLKIKKYEQDFQNRLLENIKRLEAQLSDKADTISQLLPDLQSKKQLIQGQQSQIKYNKLEIAQAKKQIEQLLQDNMRVKADHDRLKSKLAIFEDINDELISTNEDLRAELRQLEQITTSTKAQQKVEITKLQQRIQQQELTMKELDMRLQTFNNDEDKKSTGDSYLKSNEEKDRQDQISDLQKKLEQVENSQNKLQSDLKQSYRKLFAGINRIDPQLKDSLPEFDISSLDIIHEKIIAYLSKTVGERQNKQKAMMKLKQELQNHWELEKHQPTYCQNPQKNEEVEHSDKIKYLQQTLYHLQKQFGEELKQMKMTIEEKNELQEENRMLNERIEELQNEIDSSSRIKYLEEEQENDDNVKKRRKQKIVTWAQSAEINETQQPQQHIKSLKMINDMLEEAVSCTSQTFISPNNKNVQVPLTLLIYLCDLLKIPAKRSTYIQSLAVIQQIQQSQCENKIEQNENCGQIMLQNIVNYLENNSNAFPIQTLYMQVIRTLSAEIQIKKKRLGQQYNGLTLTHQAFLQVLEQYRSSNNRVSELEEEIMEVQGQLQSCKEQLYHQKMHSSQLMKVNEALNMTNDKIKAIISDQNNEIIMYRLHMEKVKKEQLV